MQQQGIRAPVSGLGMEWQRRGACVREDPELFFPVGSDPAAVAATQAARAVCARCPVAGVCLSWSLETRVSAGIWGGLTASERGAVLKARDRAARRAANAAAATSARGRVAS